MVAIARALIGAPGLVLLDEPSQGLAPEGGAGRDGADHADEGAKASRCCVVEQHARDALAVADRVYVMDLGRIVHEGAAARCSPTPRSPPLARVRRDDRAAARGRGPGQAVHARPVRPQVTFSLAADFRIAEPASRRRDGAERLRQDHAVRADHRQQPADGGPRAVRRPGHPHGARRASATGSRSTTTSPTRCAASAAPARLPARARRPRLPAGAPVRRAAVQHPGRLHRLHARLLPQAATRGAAGVPLPAPQRALPPRHPARDLRALLFVSQGRVSEAPDFAALLRDERVRGYLGDLAQGLR